MKVRKTWMAWALGALAGTAGAQETVRLSVNDQGFEANGNSADLSVSEDGRIVAFAADASNLTPMDGNAFRDVFVKDRATGEVVLVSRSYTTGMSANAGSTLPRISADGRYVCFYSGASDLVPGDTAGASDVFRADLQTGEMIRVSVSSSGTEANGHSFVPSISARGRYVTFESNATNLVPGDANGVRDVFLHDTMTGTTELVSVATGGSQVNAQSLWPTISDTGRYVAFESDATNFLLNDTNGYRDIFVRDRQLATTTRISVTSIGTQLNGDSYRAQISGDGQLVAFLTEGSVFILDNNLGADVALRDLTTGGLIGVSHSSTVHVAASAFSIRPRISNDGRWIVFLTTATNIVAGDTNGTRDAFRYDRLTGTRVRMSLSDAGGQSTGDCMDADVSNDGQVVFISTGADLVIGDSGAHDDVFVRNLGPDFPQLYCSGKPNSLGCAPFLTFAGTASASSSAPFSIQGHDFLAGESGFLIYGVNGKSNLDFHGGKLCVKLPFSRWLPFKKATSVGGACGGALMRNFNTRIQAGVDPQLTAGQVVHAQWLQRDPADPAGFGDGLSNGIRFTIGS